MGTALNPSGRQPWAAFNSTGGETFYVYADITWDDSNFYVSITNIRYTDSSGVLQDDIYFKWRIRARSNNSLIKAGTGIGYGFYAAEGEQFVLQGCTAESVSPWGGTWDSGGFTVSANSEPGGGGGGGGYNYYWLRFDRNGYLWESIDSGDYMPEGVGYHLYGAVPVSGTTTDVIGTFIITGNANGGSPNTSLEGQNVKNTYNRQFTGYNTKANGSGTWYYKGDSVAIYSDTTLYAQQSFSTSTGTRNNHVSQLPIPNPPANEYKDYTVNFVLDGGIMDYESKQVQETTSYHFSRWTTDQAGNTAASSLSSAGTVYAQWTPQANAPLEMPYPVKSGYTFIGWSTSGGGDLIPAGEVINIEQNTTFYANWESKKSIFIHDGTSWRTASAFVLDEIWKATGQ